MICGVQDEQSFNLNLDLNNLSFEYTCNYGPSGQGEELNYIDVTNKKPEAILNATEKPQVNLQNTISKVQAVRENNYSSTDNTNRNEYR